MTPEQIRLLFQASQTPELNDDQRNSLSLVNPWCKSGPVAQVIQREVARLDPQQAKIWIQEAGATLSLQAAAAQQGLTEMTPAIQAELRRMVPRTEEEQQQARIDQILSQGNPWGEPARYEERDGQSVYIPPTQGSFTNQMLLLQLSPETAARLQAEATPAAADPLTPGERAAYARYGNRSIQS